MTYYQRRLILAVALGLALLSAAFALRSLPGPTVETAAAATTPAGKYLVGLYGGYVAVYVPGQPLPVYVTDSPVAALPAADRDMLEIGIDIASEEELSAILEDYGT